MRKQMLWIRISSDTTNWAVQPQRHLDAGNFVFRKTKHCTIFVSKTKMKLICSFVFAYAKDQFCHYLSPLCFSSISKSFKKKTIK